MGPDQLNDQIRALRARAARYRMIGVLLGDAAVSGKLNHLADELDGAIEKLENARKLIATTIDHSHELWAGPNFDFFMSRLRAQSMSPAGHLMKADDWRKVAKLWIEEAESSKNHPDKALLAERAFEIAQFAEKLAIDVEAK